MSVSNVTREAGSIRQEQVSRGSHPAAGMHAPGPARESMNPGNAFRRDNPSIFTLLSKKRVFRCQFLEKNRDMAFVPMARNASVTRSIGSLFESRIVTGPIW